MSKCQCDLRTKLVGDGCRYCNAQEYIDKLMEALEEQRTWVGLTDEEMQSIAFESADALSAVFVAEAKLRSKNCSL